MFSYVVLAAVSFVGAVVFVGFQIWRAWTQRRRWAWANIVLMIVVLVGTLVLAVAAERVNTQASGVPVDVIESVTYVAGVAGVVFWFWGLAGGELVYSLTEYLDKRRTKVSRRV